MNLDSLEAFVEFSSLLNFTHAAERLNISQPALHVKIKKLSQELGVNLYTKQGRTLILTPHGEELARFGREVQDRRDDFLQTLVQGHSGRPVVLAAGAGSYLYLLGPALRHFQSQSNPGLRLLTCDATQTLEALRAGQAHMGVTVPDAVPPDMRAELIHSAPVSLVIPRDHAMARRRYLKPSDLNGLSLIVPPLGAPFRATVNRTLEAHEVVWRVAVEASGWELMLHFASLGLGATLVNGCCRIPDELRAIPIRGLPPANYYLLCKRTLAFTAAQQSLYDAILKAPTAIAK